MAAIICYFTVVAVVFLHGVESQLGPIGNTIPASLGSRLEIDCNVTGVDSTKVGWTKRTVGQPYVAIALSTTVLPGFTSVYNISLISTTTLRLVINSVAATDYSTVYDCMDTAAPRNLLSAEIASTARTVCDPSGKKALTVKSVTRNKSFTLDCPLGSAALKEIIWGKIRADGTTPETIYFNSSVVASTSAYSVSNSATLTVNSASSITELYACVWINPASGAMPSDLALYAVCSASESNNSMNILLLVATILSLKFIII